VYAPAAVLAVVLLETAVGGLVLLWAAPTFTRLRHGYEMLLGTTLGLMALGAWAAMRGPLAMVTREGAESGGADLASLGLAVTAALALAAVVAVVARLVAVARVLGLAGAAAGVLTFVPLAQLREVTAGTTGSPALGVVELLLGAVFLGAVWNGMVLGHWYLVERRLSNRYMVWMAWVNVGAVVAGLGSVLLSALNPVPCSGLSGDDLVLCQLAYSPVLAVENFTIILGIGVVALVALIAAFNVKLAKEGGRSIQAATGMFYLAVILAPAAEFAAKVRFY
jgi:hypothetical protein